MELTKIFLCFPDPHFKARKHKARIVSPGLCAEYAFVLRPAGVLYTVTDVEDLHNWIVFQLAECVLFERIPAAELEADVCVQTMTTQTEEGIKVERNSGPKFVACFRRRPDPDW